jgi:uncharacterized protein YyaL (SSP411 family)
MPNRLAQSASPYLLQHAENPVDWHEWGDAAFAEAKRRDVPVLLSVGYAACHWCHVMAHESFEDPATAAVMNAGFVCIKVDREERPDIDRIYMDATQAMTGSGGWPMTVFLTPQAEPFFAGTYYPPVSRHGMPSFKTILGAISAAWAERRADVEAQARQLTTAIARSLPSSDTTAGSPELEAAYNTIAASFDEEFGGFGGAPKFPQAPTLEFLLRIAAEPWAPDARRILEATLVAMAAGGIYDQLGGGFARYSVDRRWLIPHFEKMLYDNALLARLYLRAWQVTGNDDLRRVATETLDYMMRDLGLAEGGLASSEDADSEGAEGTFYAWDRDEFLEVAGDDGAIAAAHFGVTEGGNFEGRTVLSLAVPVATVAEHFATSTEEVAAAVTRARQALFAARLARPRPARDDKAIAAWNGLAVRALAEAAVVLDNATYLAAAQDLARFGVTEMRDDDGRLLRSRRAGVGSIPAFCDDYAATVLGLIAMHQADGEASWLRTAIELADAMVGLFAGADGGFHGVGADADTLITRPLDLMDNPVPSGNSMAAEALLALAHLTGRDDLQEHVTGALQAGGSLIADHPSAVGHLLAVAHSSSVDPRQLAIVGDPRDPATQALVAAAVERFQPDVILARAHTEGPAAIFDGRLGAATPLAYVCRGFVCDAPTGDPERLRATLGP